VFEGLTTIKDINEFPIDDMPIKYDMLDNFTPKDEKGEPLTINKSEGSLVNDIMAPIAIEIAKNNIDLKWVINKIFPQNSSDEFLTLWAQVFGVNRILGNKANGKCLFNGNKYSIIPKGLILQTQSGLKFVTIQEKSFEENEEILVSCEAIDIGTKYNVESNMIAFFMSKPSFIKSVYNPEPFTGGVDYETDKELLDRLIFKLQNSSASGNITDYERWAKEVPGVFGVRVKPLWMGPGTVKVLVTGKEGEPLDDQIILNVQNYIDPEGAGEGRGKAPIGAHVTITTLSNFYADITVINLTIETDFNLDIVKNTIKDNLKNYFGYQITDYLIRLNETRGIVAWTDGVRDIYDIRINGLRKNVAIGDEDYPTLGEVIYEYI